MPVKGYCILRSVPYNRYGSDDWIKSNSALPGGLLKSKPTWPNAFGCFATSAFFRCTWDSVSVFSLGCGGSVGILAG